MRTEWLWNQVDDIEVVKMKRAKKVVERQRTRQRERRAARAGS